MTGLNQIKKRDYSFDVFRGLCMWSIPISHFTRMGGVLFSGFMGRSSLHYHKCVYNAGVYVPVGVFLKERGKKP